MTLLTNLLLILFNALNNNEPSYLSSKILNESNDSSSKYFPGLDNPKNLVANINNLGK